MKSQHLEDNHHNKTIPGSSNGREINNGKFGGLIKTIPAQHGLNKWVNEWEIDVEMPFLKSKYLTTHS